jgi:hypothetical protein
MRLRVTALGYTVTTGTAGSLSVTDYEAGWNTNSSSGGAIFQALCNYGAALASGQRLEWIQVVTTNARLGNATSPYLDNAFAPTQPFYSLTAANRNPSLPANQLNFLD